MSVNRPARPSILKDPALQAALQRDGFAITRLFSDPEIAGLKAIVEALEDAADHDNVHLKTPFHLSAFHNDSVWKRRVYDEIHAYTQAAVATLLLDYEPLVINIHDKPPGADTALGIHQNPSFVDEAGHKSVSIWIPLIDVRQHNGTLGVLPGSHDVFDSMRAANMPDVFEGIARQLTTQYFDPLQLSAGEVVVLDDSLIHWSYPNLSDVPRMAVQQIMVPRAPQHVYYYYNQSGERPKMDLYTVDKDFFFNFNCKEEPQGLPYLSSLDYEYKNVSEDELIQRVAPQNPGIASRRKP